MVRGEGRLIPSAVTARSPKTAPALFTSTWRRSRFSRYAAASLRTSAQDEIAEHQVDVVVARLAPDLVDGGLPPRPVAGHRDDGRAPRRASSRAVTLPMPWAVTPVTMTVLLFIGASERRAPIASRAFDARAEAGARRPSSSTATAPGPRSGSARPRSRLPGHEAERRRREELDVPPVPADAPVPVPAAGERDTGPGTWYGVEPTRRPPCAEQPQRALEEELRVEEVLDDLERHDGVEAAPTARPATPS